MPFWCYILKCADGRYYTGHTDDLERRIAEHNYGGFCTFTTKRRPLQFVWAQEFATRYEALSSEMVVKKWSRAKKEALAAQDWDRLSHFAKPPRERVSTSLDTNGNGEEENQHPFVSSEVETGGTNGIAKSENQHPFVPSPSAGCRQQPLRINFGEVAEVETPGAKPC